jgi:Protein of unknown function (DUF3455)
MNRCLLAGHSPNEARNRGRHREREKELAMKDCSAADRHNTRRILLSACAGALAVALTVTLSQPAHADTITPPPVPTDIQVPEGAKAFLEGHGVGTQNYICLPCPNPTTPAAMCPDTSGFAWLLFTPEATLFSDQDRQLTTHFFSPNPIEHGTIRATWQDSRDSSTVWAKVLQSSSDPAFVAPDAIPWLLLSVVGAEGDPTGSSTLTKTTFIQRVNTSGGVAPSTGCSESAGVGSTAFVPYTADYFFYSRTHGHQTPHEHHSSDTSSERRTS